jgi:hypothetical protein
MTSAPCAVEADAGGASGGDLSNKMANAISQPNRLRKTYNPVNLVSVRRVDEARAVRARLNDRNEKRLEVSQRQRIKRKPLI